ncbi:hypothetical protein [Emticicia sp. SJ17W-69]|uniref:hypothetical protein n=1 Tax=Emticicia sp. SJ17W-69 TaxID=3421657 RepID=UPI003EB7C4D0
MSNLTESTDVLENTTQETKSKLSKVFSNRKANAIITAGILSGGGVAAFTWGLAKDETHTAPVNPTITTDSTSVNTDSTQVLQAALEVPVKDGIIKPSENVCIAIVNDGMDFETAFNTARTEVGPGGVFSWNGNVYNTYYKEEWMSLSLEQRQDFLHDIGFSPINHLQNTNNDLSIVEEPTHFIETTLNGHRVVGVDVDNDGIIDSIVYATVDGTKIMIVDSHGNEALDTIITIDSITNETIKVEAIENPEILTNLQFQTMIDEMNISDDFGKAIEDSVDYEGITSDDDNNEDNDEVEVDNTNFVNDDDNDFVNDSDYINNGNIDDMN